MGQNRLELKRATTILYTLQIASTNAARATRESPDSVEDFTTDATGNILAPDEEPQPRKPAPAPWHLAKLTEQGNRETPASEVITELDVEAPNLKQQQTPGAPNLP